METQHRSVKIIVLGWFNYLLFCLILIHSGIALEFDSYLKYFYQIEASNLQ